jgi:3-phosphoshikimate 1-carboxyvinyltransferase
VKESDRITAMASQLAKLGAVVSERPDGLEITGGQSLQGATVESFGDHRIGMSLAIASLVATGPTTILNAEAAAISYPNFVETLSRLMI